MRLSARRRRQLWIGLALLALAALLLAIALSTAHGATATAEGGGRFTAEGGGATETATPDSRYQIPGAGREDAGRASPASAGVAPRDPKIGRAKPSSAVSLPERKWTGAEKGHGSPLSFSQSRAPSPQSRLFRVSSYCPCQICCSRKAHGITAWGTRADHRLCAAPGNVPFGTRLGIPGYGAVRVEDRGGAITEGRLDVLLPTHTAAKAWGVRYLKCEVRSAE